MKIINHEEKEIIQLTDEENKAFEQQEICHVFWKKFCLDETGEDNESDENDENNENDKIVYTDKKCKKFQKVKDH